MIDSGRFCSRGPTGGVMARAESEAVLVTGSTGRVGRMVVDQLLEAGVAVRALTRQPATAAFPAAVEVVRGDFTVPDSLDDGLRGVRAVFLVWTLPLDRKSTRLNSSH